MNEFQILWKGVQLCISLQLLILGGLNILSKKNINIVLGFICIIVSSYYLKTIFGKYVDDDPLFTFFFSGGLFCFYGQLIYLYIIALEQKPSVKFYVKHFSLPFGIAIAYATIRTFFYNIFSNHATFINLFLLIVCTIWISYYFYLGIQKFNSSLNYSLISRARRKYKVFYYAINIFLLHQFFSAVLIYISNLTNNEIINFINNYYLYYFSVYFNMPLYVLLSLYLILYSLSQSKNFKSFFIGDRLHLNKEIIDGEAIIEKRIRLYFYEKKIYKDNNLKIKEAADKIGVNKTVLAEFIKNKYSTNFIGFINSLRINEFKLLLQDSNNKNYSLLGIAQEAGFKSKATFYRVFKNTEGITPNDYLATLKSNTIM